MEHSLSTIPGHQTTGQRSINTIDPLSDDRWQEFLLGRADASVFHSRPWLKALRRVYGYEPLVLTDASSGATLQNALLFCKVASSITGRRLVSVPFADHCDPLVNSEDELTRLALAAAEVAVRKGCRYVELRPRTLNVGSPFAPAASYYLHQLDLSQDVDSIHRQFHRDCIQRKIRRAEREKLTVEEGNSNVLLGHFYHLQTRARLRLGLPPQPLAWFEALMSEFGEKAIVRVAYSAGEPVASIVTLEFNRTTVYKYGCSEERSNRLGGAQAVMWAAIQDACRKGHTVFDMGRSDLDQPGLIEYKDRWGAAKTHLEYFRYPSNLARLRGLNPAFSVARQAFSKIPPSFAVWVGRHFYRHLG